MPTEAVREALERLCGAGFTRERMSELLDLDESTILRIVNGQRGAVTAATARKVLAADIDRILEAEPRSSRRVEAAPYREYLRRLRAAGWRRTDLERMAAIRPGEDNIWRDRCRYIGPGLAERLDELFRDIGWRTGDDAASMRFWRSRGYGPPAAYDEDGNLVEEWMLPTPPRAREPRVVPR
jgi:transcriptional regulator with XRE-family HTH domain